MVVSLRMTHRSTEIAHVRMCHFPILSVGAYLVCHLAASLFPMLPLWVTCWAYLVSSHLMAVVHFSDYTKMGTNRALLSNSKKDTCGASRPTFSKNTQKGNHHFVGPQFLTPIWPWVKSPVPPVNIPIPTGEKKKKRF